MESTYLYLNSSQDSTYFSENRATDFAVRLPFQFHFNNLFECCVKEIRVQRHSRLGGLFSLTADCVQGSYVYGGESRILRGFELKPGNNTGLDSLHFLDPYYIPVVENTSSVIRFRINSLHSVDGFDPDSVKKVWLVLHFRPRQ